MKPELSKEENDELNSMCLEVDKLEENNSTITHNFMDLQKKYIDSIDSFGTKDDPQKENDNQSQEWDWDAEINKIVNNRK